MAPTKDEKLLGTESPQEQADRMGNGWTLQEQYEKQLELPVHMIQAGKPVAVERDKSEMLGYVTVCGEVLGGEHTIRTTDDPDDVTCPKCSKKK